MLQLDGNIDVYNSICFNTNCLPADWDREKGEQSTVWLAEEEFKRWRQNLV
jgi:hypothetical protein